MEATPSVYNTLDVDLLSWHRILNDALFSVHGLVGQARYFDLLVKQTQLPALKAILRVEREDVAIFVTSLSNHMFTLGDMLGGDNASNAYVRVTQQSDDLADLLEVDLVGN